MGGYSCGCAVTWRKDKGEARVFKNVTMMKGMGDLCVCLVEGCLSGSIGKLYVYVSNGMLN